MKKRTLSNALKLMSKNDALNLKENNDGTITIIVRSPKGGCGKTVTTVGTVHALASMGVPLNIVYVTADVNEGAIRLFTDEYCETQFPKNVCFKSIAIKDAATKSASKINFEISRQLLADERLEDHIKSKGIQISEDLMEDTFYLENNGEIQPVDVLLYDVAGGINQIETDKVSRDSLDRFMTVELANDIDSKNNAISTIREMAMEEIEYTKRYLTEEGYMVEKMTPEQIQTVKEQIGFTYTYVYSKNYNGKLSASDPRSSLKLIKEIEEEFNIKVNFLIQPYVRFNELKKRNLAFTITQENAKEQGHKIGRLKTVDKHPEYQEFLKDMVKCVFDDYTSTKYELMVK